MGIYSFSPQNEAFFERMVQLKSFAADPCISSKQMQKIANELGLILQNPYSESLGEREITLLTQDALHLLNQLEQVQEVRTSQDKQLLSKLTELSFEMKQLKLEWDLVSPSEIQTRIEDFAARFDELLQYQSFQVGFFQKELQREERNLQDLLFLFHFPILQLLDVSLENDEEVVQFYEKLEPFQKAQILSLADSERAKMLLLAKDPKQIRIVLEKYFSDQEKLAKLAKEIFFTKEPSVQDLKETLTQKQYDRLNQEIFKITTATLEELDHAGEKTNQIISVALMRIVEKNIL